MRPIEERSKVLWLYLKEHKSYGEIVKITGICCNTVKSWISQCRRDQGLLIGNHSGPAPRARSQASEELYGGNYEKRIRQLEMEVELLGDFLAEEESRSIGKYFQCRIYKKL